jgi:hypothetical protein
MSILTAALAGCSSSGPTAADIARDACALARRVEQGKGNILSVALEANDLRKKASDHNISFSDVLSAAQNQCPDVIDNLGL